MKKLLTLGILCIIGSYAIADSGIQSRMIPKRSAIQHSSYNDTKSEYYVSPEILSAIEELKLSIKKEPYNYGLYSSLVDLYFQTRQYEKAYEELVFLNNISQQGKLSENIKAELNIIFNSYKKTAKYSNSRTQIYADFAIIQLILNNYDKTQNCLNLALYSATKADSLTSAIKTIFDTTKNINEAISFCDVVLEKFPESIDIRKLKASYLLQSNNAETALKEYYTILQLTPTDLETKYNAYRILAEKGTPEKNIIKQIYNSEAEDAYYDLSEILLKRGEAADAKQIAKALTERYPNYAKGYILLSELYKKEGDPKSAYEVLAKARDKAANNEDAAKYNVMLAKLSDEPVKEANSLMTNKLYQQALDVLEEANPDDLYVILTQARANYMMNNTQKTFEYLNKAMSIYPENSDVYCAFGYIYLKEKDIESARKYVNSSLKIDPENGTAKALLDLVNQTEADLYVNQIISSYEAQNYGESMRLIDEALNINEKDSNLYYYKALNYIAQNNYASSTAMLYKCIELDKRNVPAYFYLGLAFDNLSEPENALTYYQQYINMADNDEYEEQERMNYAKQRIAKLEK